MTPNPSRAPLDPAAARALEQSLPGWALSPDGKAIVRGFKFRDFEATMDFVNRLAAIAERKDHHPDLKVGYGYCEVLFTTHDAGGLTVLDADCVRETQHLADELASAKRVARKYAWSEMPGEQVNPSMIRRMIAGDRTLVASMKFKDGFVVPQHHHVHEQVTLVKSGTLRFFLGTDRSQVVDVGPGEVLVIPSRLPHEVLCIGEVEEMDVFTPRREDWLDGSDAYLRR
jgi:pterin-4a-carbinolamine dehydratase/quercetin dioxygenase-like cupin family protein